MNTCHIKYCGKDEKGIDRYWCLTHKDVASDEDGYPLKECLCKYKEIYNNQIKIEPKNIDSIKVIYKNVLEEIKPVIYLNQKEENYALEIKDSILDFKDIGGLMISKLNSIKLIPSFCSYCGKPHTDDGVFAYTPHAKHLCQYCGYFYNVEKANIGNEFALFFDVPDITLEEGIVDIEDTLCLEYDVLKGILFSNGKNVNKVKVKGKIIYLKTYLNELFKDEY